MKKGELKNRAGALIRFHSRFDSLSMPFRLNATLLASSHFKQILTDIDIINFLGARNDSFILTR